MPVSTQPDEEPGGALAPLRHARALSRMGELHVTEVWRSQIRGWEEYLRAADRPATTIYLRTYHLRRLAHAHPDLAPTDVGMTHLIRWLAGHEWSTETRRSYRASIRGFYGWAVLAGHMPTSPAGLLPPIAPKRGCPRPIPETMLTAALAGAGDRERLLLSLAAHAGLRRGEIARVHSRDIVEDLDGWSLHVLGKGGHRRMVPLTPALSVALRSLPAGWCFPGDVAGHLSAAHVGKLISARLPDGWTAHTLRHRFATRLRARGVQLDVIQELLGHARIETTRIYAAVPVGALRAAVMQAA